MSAKRTMMNPLKDSSKHSIDTTCLTFTLPTMCIHYFRKLSGQRVLILPYSSNPLRMKWTSSYHAINTFHLGYKNQAVYVMFGTSRCLLQDKYQTHKYSVGRTYKF